MNRCGLLTLPACALIAGCGGATSSPRRASQVVTLLMAAAPDSLDPAVGHTAEALEADWLVYTPLLTYLHSDGTPGTQLTPGFVSDRLLYRALVFSPVAGLDWSSFRLK